MIKHALALAGLTLSVSVGATTVSYNGYALDTTTNIVTGGGLEWLQWDETLGQSASEALASYAADGWRLASNTEMAALLNSFSFGIVIDTDEATLQSIELPDTEYSFGAANQFIDLFGDTFLAGGGQFDLGDPYEETRAIFGEDGDADNSINFIQVWDEYTFIGSSVQPGLIEVSADTYGINSSNPNIGVALVRVSAVPIPATLWLFGSALLGLAGIKRRN